ncbi:MAG: helix-turn-helix domain-containing protein [Dehalococcoidia bacterium]|nr:MAG: helix-turn-helix domain-containing protein [Dehalococcoidia bacterium]
MQNIKVIPQMLTVRDVATLLNIHVNTVRRWSDQGILQAYRITSRGDRRFRRDDVEEFLANMNNNGGDPHKALITQNGELNKD